MKKMIAAFLTSAACIAASASPSLIGTWTSSRELSMAFARDHARLEPRTEKFLNQMMGRLTVRFDADRIAYDLPDWDVEVEGVGHRMVGFREAHPYKILFVNDTSVVVQGAQPVTGKQVVTVYNFVDDNTMWIYCGSPDKGLPDMNIREYFVRVK